MFEQDYIMRLIREMVRTMAKLVFKVDIDDPKQIDSRKYASRST